MSMKLETSDLLPGESSILSIASNAVVKLSDHGLSQFAFDQYMWAVGMKNKESIGGNLHLTSYRLLFKSHGINRLTGKFSIFLPTIKAIKDTSFFITKKVTISTQLTNFDFVVWGIPAFIKATQEAMSQLKPEELEKLQRIALEQYEKCSEGLKTFGGLETVNKAFLFGKKAQDVIGLCTNPLEALGALAFEELFDKTISESWQTKFEKQ